MVKRLIGLPGDRLKLANGVVYRNGIRLNEPYGYHKYAYDPAADNFPTQCCRPVKEDSAQQAQREMLDQHVVASEVIVPADMYFAMGDNSARYYGSALGRYTSPDEPFADQRSIDPQSWNLYTYAANNPLTFIDRTGKAIELSGDDDQRRKQLTALQAAAGKKAGAYLYDNTEKDANGSLTGRLFVGILGGGPSGKGPDFGSINAVAKDIAGVVADTQIARVHLVDVGQTFFPMGPGSSPASLDSRIIGDTSPFNAAPPIQIWLLNPDSSSYDGIGPWAMSDGQPGARTLPDNFLHELGHAAWQMDIKGGRQANPADPYGNRRAVDFEDDVRRLRGGAERTYHDTPGDAGR